MLRKPSILFLIVALVFGLITIYLTPPFQSPDETNHFHRSIHISEGHVMGEKRDGNRLGGMLSTDALRYTLRYDYVRKSDNPKFNNIATDLYKNPDTPEKTFIDFANVGYYSPTVYLPQVIGVAFAKRCNLGIYYQFYLGRLTGFLAWVFLIFLAIRIIPIGKYLLLFVALLPASISLHSTLTGDSFSNALSFLWIALMIRAITTDHKINVKEWIMLLLIIACITINKLVYFPLTLMIIMIPSVNMKWANWMKGIILFVVLLILMMWIPYGKSMFIPYDFYAVELRDVQQLNEGVRPDEQLQYILSNPFRFIRTAIISYIESAPSTWSHYIGKFGWEKNYIPFVVIGLLTFVLGGLSLTRMKNETILSTKQRIQFLGIALFMIAGFTVSIYMQWSPVGNDRIWSLSGRYFFAIMPVFLFALPKFQILENSKWSLLPVCFSIIGLVFLMYSIGIRYY